jgi:outer membrane receptor protein involved in Fe transport
MLADRIQTPVVDFDCVGYFGAQCEPYPTPEWRHRARISWETNFNMVFTLAWRYIDAVLIDDASPDPDLADPESIELWKINDGYENPAFNYFDIAWTWDFADHYQVVLGCNNILDEEPPLGADQNDNDYGPGFYGFYDPYGRALHAAIHCDF